MQRPKFTPSNIPESQNKKTNYMQYQCCNTVTSNKCINNPSMIRIFLQSYLHKLSFVVYYKKDHSSELHLNFCIYLISNYHKLI